MGWLERVLPDGWIVGNAFTMADCAAAPALFYADKTHPLKGRFRSRGISGAFGGKSIECSRPQGGATVLASVSVR